MLQRFWRQGRKLRCHHCSFGLILQDLRLLRPTQSWQDISISCDISITSPFSPSLSTSMAALQGESMWDLQTRLPPLPPLMYWPALARWDGPLAARHATLEGQCSATPPPPTHIAVACTSCKAIFDPSFFTLHLTIFWVCSLLGHKGGVCVSLGGRCCISDLPLPEIGFGDIRTQGFGWAPSLPQPPSAEPAIMPSMSNRFSIKMQTSTSLSFSAAKYCPVEEQAAGSGGAVIP